MLLVSYGHIVLIGNLFKEDLFVQNFWLQVNHDKLIHINIHTHIHVYTELSKYHAAPHYINITQQWAAKAVNKSKLSPSHNNHRIAKVDMTFVVHQEWHSENGILLELNANKCLTGSLILNSATVSSIMRWKCTIHTPTCHVLLGMTCLSSWHLPLSLVLLVNGSPHN